MIIKKISCINASDFPKEVQDYCRTHNMSIYNQNNIVWINNDDNVFAKWLTKNGCVFPNNDGMWVGIIGT